MNQPVANHVATVRVFPSAASLGEAAALDVAAELRKRLASQERVRIIFAAAPSQAAMLHALAAADGIAWDRVEAFHMDEYIGLPQQAPQRFGHWLKREFFDHVPIGKLHLIEPEPDASAAAGAYATLLSEAPVDIVCLGIGMNGHLAFNDPPADFSEKQNVRIVELDAESRKQQVNEKLFPTLDAVPTHAITLSIPRLLSAEKLFCCVSGDMKNAAVVRALTGEISSDSPASILRDQAGCTIYLDQAAAAGLNPGDR